MNLVAELSVLSDSAPDAAVFEQLKWLTLTRGEWRSERMVVWIIAARFRPHRDGIQRVGTPALRPTDPSQSNSYGGWNLLGQQVLLQQAFSSPRQQIR